MDLKREMLTMGGSNKELGRSKNAKLMAASSSLLPSRLGSTLNCRRLTISTGSSGRKCPSTAGAEIAPFPS